MVPRLIAPHLGLRRAGGTPRVGEPIDSIAGHLQRLVARLALVGLLTALLFVAALDDQTAAEVALSLANMGVVVVTSWHFGPAGRWATVGLAALFWTAAVADLPALGWPPAISWWDGFTRLGVLVILALAVSTFHEALTRLRTTEDALAAALIRERDSARRDRLTRLWNSRYFHDALEREIERGRRYGRPFGLVLMDLDGFKGVNDTAGHLAGDLVLQIVGDVLRRNCRATDIPARLGGDEFAVILPEASPEMVRRFAGRLVTLMSQVEFPAHLPRVTTSVGGVAFDRPPASGKAVVAAADAAMYAAKREGKNRAFVPAAEPVS